MGFRAGRFTRAVINAALLINQHDGQQYLFCVKNQSQYTKKFATGFDLDLKFTRFSVLFVFDRRRYVSEKEFPKSTLE